MQVCFDVGASTTAVSTRTVIPVAIAFGNGIIHLPQEVGGIQRRTVWSA